MIGPDLRRVAPTPPFSNAIHLIGAEPARPRLRAPVAIRIYGAVIGFMTCGAAVIVTASVLALHIQ